MIKNCKTEWEPAETGSPDHHRLDESRLAIPRQVGLHQSPLPLRQPRTIVAQKRLINYGKPSNSKCANCILSQRRGSPHGTVPRIVPTRQAM